MGFKAMDSNTSEKLDYEEGGIPAPIENLSKMAKSQLGQGSSDIVEFFDIVHKQTRPVLSLTVRLSYPNIAWLLAYPLTASQLSSGTGVRGKDYNKKYIIPSRIGIG